MQSWLLLFLHKAGVETNNRGACAAKSAHCMVKVFFAAYHTAKVKFALNVVQYTQNGQQCNTMESFNLKSIGVDLEQINGSTKPLFTHH